MPATRGRTIRLGKCKECGCITKPSTIPSGNLLARPESDGGVRPQLQTGKEQEMKNDRQRRECIVHVRLTPDEMDRIRTLMDNAGYISVSGYMRDLLDQKRIPYHREVVHVTDKMLRDRVNILIYQVNKIGVNYNQVVATWQKQAGQTRRDGTPWMDTRSVEMLLGDLKRMTEGLRDEFAVMLDILRKYIGESRDQ